jgi:RNA polymerase sigma factor (TIGR02999 family)
LVTPATRSFTVLLDRAKQGDRQALDELFPLLYEELRAMAARSMRAERGSHTLRPTALVHEAYLRLIGQRTEWHDRAHFLAIAAQTMRRVLVDYARAHHASKRGAAVRIALDEAADHPVDGALPVEELIAINEALEAFEILDRVASQVVELRYFAGLTIDETARALNLSPATVKREWCVARAWLHRRLSGESRHDA